MDSKFLSRLYITAKPKDLQKAMIEEQLCQWEKKSLLLWPEKHGVKDFVSQLDKIMLKMTKGLSFLLGKVEKWFLV